MLYVKYYDYSFISTFIVIYLRYRIQVVSQRLDEKM